MTTITMTDKDACDLLDADHIAVKHLFVEYALLMTAPVAGRPDEREALAQKICEELTVHAAIEEEIFYPAVEAAVPGLAAQMKEAREEHQQAKDLIAKIRTAQVGAELDSLVADLNRAIEHHVKEERDEIFPKARAAKQLDLMQLARQLAERQQELQASEPA